MSLILAGTALASCLVSASGTPMSRSHVQHRVKAAHVRRPETATPPPPCSEVAAYVQLVAAQALSDFNVTGLSVGVVCNHSVVFAGGFGMADAATKRPATSETLYQVLVRVRVTCSI
jgi:CubicO group peptidase (beta-lactamase class C family)